MVRVTNDNSADGIESGGQAFCKMTTHNDMKLKKFVNNEYIICKIKYLFIIVIERTHRI